jgi:O-antigen/teichoic acid export membrane protein
MRVQNSLNNMIFGLTGQVISLLMGFLVRTVFIKTLGIEYLGIGGLFTSILTMLSLANLGFDTAIIYSLYQPLAEKDIYKIKALMNLYEKAYRIIGIIVLSIGLIIMPFIPSFIGRQTNIENIKFIYILFLINSVLSYYFVYKQSIIIADQHNYIISKIHSVFIILSNVIQVILLISMKDYIWILIFQIIIRVSENISISRKADKLYPFLRERDNIELSIKEKKIFFQNLYSLILYKISGVVISGTDNIVISRFVGISWVGLYSNYLLITDTLNTFLGYIFYSVTASVGNLNVKESKEKKYLIFRVLRLLNFWIYGFLSICLWNLLNPFISIWIGSQFTMSKLIVFSMITNFYTCGMQNTCTTFRDTTGLFKNGKYRPIYAAIINIGASILLAKLIGVAGVLLGTVISRLSTYFWYDPFIIYRKIFQRSVKEYFIRYIYFGLLVVVSSIITNIIGNNIITNNMLLSIIYRMIICMIVSNVTFFILFKESEEFKYLINMINPFLKKGALIFKKEYKDTFAGDL